MNEALPPNIFSLSESEYTNACDMLKTASWMRAVKTDYGEFQDEESSKLTKLLSTFHLLIEDFRLFCDKPSLKYFKQGLASLDHKWENPTVISSYSLILRAGAYVKYIYESLITITNDYIPSGAKIGVFYIKDKALRFIMPSGQIDYMITGSTQKRILEPYFSDDDISSYSIASKINANQKQVEDSFYNLSRSIANKYPGIGRPFEIVSGRITLAKQLLILNEHDGAGIN